MRTTETIMQRKILPCFFLLLVLSGLPVLGSRIVYGVIQHRLKIKMEGRFVPQIAKTSFYLKDAYFQWEDKVRFENGDLRVDYSPVSFLNPNGLRIRLSGKNLQVHLLGDWAKMEGVERATLEKFNADFSLGRKGLNEIYWVQVDSRAFQFQLKKSEK